MLRSLLAFSLVLGMSLPLTAGEMDNDNAVKKATPAATSANVATANSELDKESPTQAWCRRGYGGWGCGYRACYSGGWGGGCYRPYYGGWGCGYRSYYGPTVYGAYYGGGLGVSVAYARPWGGVSVGFGW